MELSVLGVIKSLKFLATMLVSLSGAPTDGRSIHLILVRLQLLKEMPLGFKIWPSCVVLSSLQFHEHFGI